jgi:hypothetical protein
MQLEICVMTINCSRDGVTLLRADDRGRVEDAGDGARLAADDERLADCGFEPAAPPLYELADLTLATSEADESRDVVDADVPGRDGPREELRADGGGGGGVPMTNWGNFSAKTQRPVCKWLNDGSVSRNSFEKGGCESTRY